MHVPAVESGSRLLLLTGMADGNAGDGDDRGGQLKNLLELPDAVFPRVNTQPAGAQTKTMRAQQQILDGRRAILQQITELAIVRRIKIAADHDSQRSRGQHAAVGQSRRDG